MKTNAMEDLFIGIDLGTTLCKCVIADAELNILGSASRRMPVTVGNGGTIEQDANLWWTSTLEAISEILLFPDVRADRVCGIGISTQGISLVPVDKDSAPLRPALSWMDVRAAAQTDTLKKLFGEDSLFKSTGKRCNEAYTLPKLLWLQEHEPEICARAAKFLLPMDFLVAKFTGEFVTDHTMASGTMYYDIRNRAWAENILDAFDLDAGKLPALRWSGEAVGTIRQGVADALGISPSTLIAVGGQDQKVAALGAGIGGRRATLSLGTAMAILRQSEKPLLDPLMRIPCFTDLAKDHWVIEASSDCCSILDWMKRTFSPGLDYRDINRLAEEAGSEAADNGDSDGNNLASAPLLVLPFFSGAGSPYYRPSARGLIAGLDYSAGPGRLIRGFYEGMACLIRSNLEVMEELAGPTEELRIFGGGSRSSVWCQIIADICGKPVQALATPEAASLGTLLLAKRGVTSAASVFIAEGECDTRKSSIRILDIRANYAPREEAVGRSGRIYEAYRGLVRSNVSLDGS